MDGFGMYYWPDGRMFEGEFSEGRKIGQGKFYWPDGKIYEGEFKNDNCGGQGTLFYPDGKRFEGGWKDGAKHGRGYYYYEDGCILQIVYQDGKKTSDGKLVQGATNREVLKNTHMNLKKKAKAQVDLIASYRACVSTKDHLNVQDSD